MSYILVNTPENGCQSYAFLFYGEPYAFCDITRMEISKEEYEVQEQCPLRTLPERKDNKMMVSSEYERVAGFNECLDEIEGIKESENKIK